MPLLSAPERFSGFVAYDRPVATLTTWGVGGTPGCLISPRNNGEIADSLAWLRTEGVSFEVLGGGSNVLIAEGEFPIALFHTRGLCGTDVSIVKNEVFIECGAGVTLRSLFSLALRSGWSGLEFTAGIPGTVGGAILGNAGTREGDMRDVVSEVETVEPDGSVRRWTAREIVWDYRRCALTEVKGRILSSAKLKLAVSSRESVFEAARASVLARNGQPRGVKSAGCVFKNPPGDNAGRLLDASGCKSFSIGGARVSPVHANFIENYTGASAEDILSLMFLCRERVFEHFGVELEFEVKFIGIPMERLR